MTIPTESDRYKSLLLGMCKYHNNLKDEAQFLRDLAFECQDDDSKKAFGLRRKAEMMTNQRKGVLWMLNRRRPDLEGFFGTHVIEQIAEFDFEEGDTLLPIETVPASLLGVPKVYTEGKRVIGPCSNWRMAHLDL